MGLIEQELKELNEIKHRIYEGTIKPQELTALSTVYSHTEKREKMVLQSMALSCKYGGAKGIKEFKNSNLIGGAITLENHPSIQILACPDTGKAITREQCLDYSGEAKNLESCQSCKEFNVTRNILLKKE